MGHIERMNRSQVERALNGQIQNSLRNKTMTKLIFMCSYQQLTNNWMNKYMREQLFLTKESNFKMLEQKQKFTIKANSMVIIVTDKNYLTDSG